VKAVALIQLTSSWCPNDLPEARRLRGSPTSVDRRERVTRPPPRPALHAPDPRRCRSRVRAQAGRLARQLDRIWDTPIPFFRRKLEAAGLGRADLRGLDDLPVRHGEARLRASEEEHLPFATTAARPRAPPRARASTGTSGSPTLIPLDPPDPRVDTPHPRAGAARGLRPGMSLANAHPRRDGVAGTSATASRRSAC
jgi:hypothetical protein